MNGTEFNKQINIVCLKKLIQFYKNENKLLKIKLFNLNNYEKRKYKKIIK